MDSISWDELEKKRKENKRRMEKLRKKLDELHHKLKENGIDPEEKLYMELGSNDIIEDYERVDEFYAAYPDLKKFYIPNQTVGLSFHDLDCNEYALMDLPASKRKAGQIEFSVVKAMGIFTHTFLENVLSD